MVFGKNLLHKSKWKQDREKMHTHAQIQIKSTTHFLNWNTITAWKWLMYFELHQCSFILWPFFSPVFTSQDNFRVAINTIILPGYVSNGSFEKFLQMIHHRMFLEYVTKCDTRTTLHIFNQRHKVIHRIGKYLPVFDFLEAHNQNTYSYKC